MTAKLRPFSNTHLGEVHWYADEFFGDLLFVCQGLLGLDPKDKHNYHFINDKKYTVDELREFFEEIECEDGMLGLRLLSDANWCERELAFIETTIPFGEEFTDQMFLNLVSDFIEHVRGLPLCDPSKRKGSLWTEEDVESGHSEQAAEAHRDAWERIGGNPEDIQDYFKEAGLVRIETGEDDIPF